MNSSSTNAWNDLPSFNPALILALPAPGGSPWHKPAAELLSELEARLPVRFVSWADSSQPEGLRSALAAARFHGATSAVVVHVWGGRQSFERAPARSTLHTMFTEAPPDCDAILAAYHSSVIAAGDALPRAACA